MTIQIKRGEAITASRQNLIARSAELTRGARSGGGTIQNDTAGGPVFQQSSSLQAVQPGVVVHGYNATNEPFNLGEVMAITGQPFTSNSLDFHSDLVLNLNKVAAETDKVVVLLDSLNPGEVGRVMIQGIARVLVQGDATLQFASPLPEEYVLETASGGVFELLWQDAGTAERWAIARFPVGGSGFNPPEVDKLPPIPTTGTWHACYHKTDGQIWWCRKGDARWSPGFKWSSNKGTPGT